MTKAARDTFEAAKKDPVKAGKKAVDIAKAGASVRSSVKGARTAATELKTKGFQASWRDAREKVVQNAINPKDKLNVLSVAKKTGTAAGIVSGLVALPKQISTFAGDVRNALRTRSSEDWNKALGSGAQLGGGVVKTAKAGLETARDVHKFGAAYKAARSTFQGVAPKASKKVTAAASRAAAKAAFEGASTRVAQSATKAAAAAAIKNGDTVARAVVGSGTRAAGRATLNAATKGAAKAAVTAGARAAAGPVAKAAGRFVPGMNVAIAAFDVASAVSTVRDPKAGMGKKITSVITAVGSVAAATNIPIVSQVGAAVSTVSGLVGGFFK